MANATLARGKKYNEVTVYLKMAVLTFFAHEILFRLNTNDSSSDK